jgi:hypothetical protein
VKKRRLSFFLAYLLVRERDAVLHKEILDLLIERDGFIERQKFHLSLLDDAGRGQGQIDPPDILAGSARREHDRFSLLLELLDDRFSMADDHEIKIAHLPRELERTRHSHMAEHDHEIRLRSELGNELLDRFDRGQHPERRDVDVGGKADRVVENAGDRDAQPARRRTPSRRA